MHGMRLHTVQEQDHAKGVPASLGRCWIRVVSRPIGPVEQLNLKSDINRWIRDVNVDLPPGTLGAIHVELRWQKRDAGESRCDTNRGQSDRQD